MNQSVNHSNLISCKGQVPKLGEDCFLAPTATLVGDVIVGRQCSIWYNAVLRGDVFPIRVGDETNIQDGAILHGTYKKCGATVGHRVSIGHGAIIHGCTIGDRTLIGMGAIIMDLAVIGSQCIVGAGSLVTENSNFESGWLILGRPAKAIRKLTAEELAFLEKSADNYKMYTTWYEK